MSRLHRVRGDDGASLILALVFMMVVGLFASFALHKSRSTSMLGQEVRGRGQLQYALDGGMEHALHTLRDEVASGSPGSCTDPSDAPGTGTLSLNDEQSTWSCTTLAGRTGSSSNADARNYALLLTDSAAGALSSQSGVSQVLAVAGSVYLNGKVTNADIGKPIDITAGDLVTPERAGCLDDLDALTNVRLTGTGQGRYCTEQSLALAMPTVALPSPAPATSLTTFLGAGYAHSPAGKTCHIFYPGLYTSPPTISNNSHNYFVSGYYYFRDIGPWLLNEQNVQIVAGSRSASSDDTPVPPTHCSALGIDDDTALELLDSAVPGMLPSISPWLLPHGATWVFGGNSTLDVRKGAVTMFSPPSGGSTSPVNLVGASPWTGSAYVHQPSGTRTLTGGGNNASMQLNGKVFAPSSDVEIFSTNNTVAAVRGGVVALRALLKASAAGSEALAISAPGSIGNPPPPYRTVAIDATDGSGATAARQRAVATISNFPPHTVDVLSWRTAD